MANATNLSISDFISEWANSPFGQHALLPWDATTHAADLIVAQINRLDSAYRISGTIAVHTTARIEDAAVVKGPAIIGPNAFVAANAYLRGGVVLGDYCIVGPSCELKTTFMFAHSKVAHLSFVGDSLIGARANIEAGAIVANYRNERADKRIRIRWQEGVIETGVEKFGALIGDDARIGANAVVAPGALLQRDTVIPRLGLVDQSPVELV